MGNVFREVTKCDYLLRTKAPYITYNLEQLQKIIEKENNYVQPALILCYFSSFLFIGIYAHVCMMYKHNACLIVLLFSLAISHIYLMNIYVNQ